MTTTPDPRLAMSDAQLVAFYRNDGWQRPLRSSLLERLERELLNFWSYLGNSPHKPARTAREAMDVLWTPQ